MSTLNGSSLLTGITSGLTSTYSILANASSGGVTLETINAARSNTSLATTLNPTFASYIQTNFASIDTDRDGILSAKELSSMTNKIATQGVTQAQLSQLGTATGLSSETLEQVLQHFSDIDANHDGRVTNAEITAYSLKSAEENKKMEFANKAAKNMSVFYGDDDTAADSASLVAYKYMNNGSTAASGSSSTSGSNQ